MDIFGNDPTENYFLYDEFFSSSVRCPGCGASHELDVVDGSRDSRYRCSGCGEIFSVDWVSRSVRLVPDQDSGDLNLAIEITINIDDDMPVKLCIQKTLPILEEMLGRFQQILKPMGSRVNREGAVHLNLHIGLESKADGLRWKKNIRGIKTELEDFRREATQSRNQFRESIRVLRKGQKKSSDKITHAIDTCLNTYDDIFSNLDQCMEQVELALMKIDEFLADPENQ